MPYFYSYNILLCFQILLLNLLLFLLFYKIFSKRIHFTLNLLIVLETTALYCSTFTQYMLSFGQCDQVDQICPSPK
jgi:hypothetical protein